MAAWARRSQRLSGPIRAVHSDMWYWNHYKDSFHTGINTAYTDGSVHWLDQSECDFWVQGMAPRTGDEITEAIEVGKMVSKGAAVQMQRTIIKVMGGDDHTRDQSPCRL